MRRLLLGLLILGLVAAPAMAGPMAAPAVQLYGAPGGTPRAVSVYESTAVVYGTYDTEPGHINGDDLHMVSGGVLDTLSFTVFNAEATGGSPITTCDLTVDFYDMTGMTGTYPNWPPTYTSVGQLTWTGIQLDLPAGYYTVVSAADISGIATINLPADILATLTITNVTGGAALVGTVAASPPGLGTSDPLQMFWDGQWYNYGAGYPADLYWTVGIVPEPGTLVMLALGGLLMIRRRS